MRDPRPQLPWSKARCERRTAYARWMASDAWQDRRRRWADTWVAVHGKPPTCAACGGLWSLDHGDLHHRSYQHLGSEPHGDLAALCRTCHRRLHLLIESTPSWRRLGRRRATDTAIAVLRRQHIQQP